LHPELYQQQPTFGSVLLKTALSLIDEKALLVPTVALQIVKGMTALYAEAASKRTTDRHGVRKAPDTVSRERLIQQPSHNSK
jgi:hypothetical protein